MHWGPDLSEGFHLGEVGAACLAVVVEEPGHKFGGADGEIDFKDNAFATGFDWFFEKLSGNLKTEILQSSQRKANGDYAKLIKLYFEELAKAGQGDGEK